jgi:hypothetical protein
LPFWTLVRRIDSTSPTLFSDGVPHHEALHRHRSPGIENRQPPAGLAPLQGRLGFE